MPPQLNFDSSNINSFQNLHSPYITDKGNIANSYSSKLNKGGGSGLTATDYMGGLYMMSAVTSAFSTYMAGQQQKLAYKHQAAMAELQARQVEAQKKFAIADRIKELRDSIAEQQVMAVAQGRTGGSVDAVYNTSIANYERDKKMIEMGHDMQIAQHKGDAKVASATGNYAAKAGTFGATSDLISGGAKSAEFWLR